MNKICRCFAVLLALPSGLAVTAAAAAPVAANPFAERIEALRKAHAKLLEDVKKLDVAKLNKDQLAEKAGYDKDLAGIGAALKRDVKEDELPRFEGLVVTHRKTVERHKLGVRIGVLREGHAKLIEDVKKLDVAKLNKDQLAEKAVYDKDLAEIAAALKRGVKEEELPRFEKLIVAHRKTIERHKIALKPFAKPQASSPPAESVPPEPPRAAPGSDGGRLRLFLRNENDLPMRRFLSARLFEPCRCWRIGRYSP